MVMCGGGVVGDRRDIPNKLALFGKGHQLVQVQGDGSGENVEESKEVHTHWGLDACGSISGGAAVCR